MDNVISKNVEIIGMRPRANQFESKKNSRDPN